MYFSDLIKLKSISETYTNDNGHVTHEWQEREVFAEKHSVTRSEFFAANQIGVNATIAFKVHTDDYCGETLIECDGKEYSVVRTYQITPDIIDITCTGKGNRHGGI